MEKKEDRAETKGIKESTIAGVTTTKNNCYDNHNSNST